MAENDHCKAIRIDFDTPADFPTKYASNLVVQHTEHDFTITFFDIRPPLLVGSPDDKASQLDAVQTVKAVPLARIVVAASRMHEFVQVLQDNLKTYLARDKQPAGDRE
jgi:hypothetical protein